MVIMSPRQGLDVGSIPTTCLAVKCDCNKTHNEMRNSRESPSCTKGESKKAVNGNCETLNTVLADTCARSNQHLLSQLSWDEHLPYSTNSHISKLL